MSATLNLFDQAQLIVDGQVESLANKQSLLLAAYLAYHESWVLRDELLALFWPDDTEKKARHNLSQLSYQLKKQKWVIASKVEIESKADAFRWLIDTDVKTFRDAHGAGEWARAYQAYRGNLLDASFTGMSAPFENWLQLERENLQQTWFEATLNYIVELEQQENYVEAIHISKQLLKQNSLAEDVLQVLVRSLHKVGQRAEAIKAFESFREQLRLELDMEPLEETIELLAELKNTQPEKPEKITKQTSVNTNNSTVSPTPTSTNTTNISKQNTGKQIAGSLNLNTSTATTITLATKEPLLRNLPTQLTPFVGREIDLAEIANYLNSVDTRLLTLLGPGGMGKTRLSIQTMLEQVDNFEDGAVFVGLAALSSKNDNLDNLIQEFAKALGTSFTDKDSPKEQLLDFLRAKEILIVLDNFEHILDATSIVQDILESSAKSKLLVTSREALGFQSEWIYEVKGLGVPPSGDISSIELHDASQLFLRRARRVNPQFKLQDSDKHFVAQICQLLGGVPLALELAANWLRILSLEEIASDLSTSFDLLETTQKDLPTRHHSIRGIFEQSWELMSQQEREALIKLTVFRGGFSKEASDKITKTPVRTLLSLSNKSMIYRDVSGRFERHPLVFEFSQEKAQSEAFIEELNTIRAEHATYYADFLASKETLLWSAKQQETLSIISSELENIRLAWEWMTENHSEDLLYKALPSLGYYYNVLNISTESLEVYNKGLQAVNADGLTYANLLLYKGNLLRKISEFDLAKESLEQAKKSLKDSRDPQGEAQAMLHLAGLYFDQDDFETAMTHLDSSLVIFKKYANKVGEAQVLGLQGRIQTHFGEYTLAESLHQETLAIHRELEYQQGIADHLSHLARTYSDLGNNELALNYAQEAYEIQKTLDKNSGQTKVLESLAHLSWSMGDYDQAEIYVREGIRILTIAGQRSAIATSLINLGVLASEKNDLEAANGYFYESLQISKTLGLDRKIVTALTDLGEVAGKQAEYETAKGYFNEALQLSKQRLADVPAVLNLLLELSRVYSFEKSFKKAYEILFTIKDHSALKQHILEKVDKLFEEVDAELDEGSKESIASDCVRGGLEPLVEKLLSL